MMILYSQLGRAQFIFCGDGLRSVLGLAHVLSFNVDSASFGWSFSI